MTADPKPTVPVHECRPLYVAGVWRCTHGAHWWQPITGRWTYK